MSAILLGPIFVNHYPYTYGDKKYEEPWKQAIFNECKATWGQRSFLKKPVRLKMTFYLRGKDLDLTGMLESSVNALGMAIFGRRAEGRKTGWDPDDRWVHFIEASKEFRPDNHGVEITIEEL